MLSAIRIANWRGLVEPFEAYLGCRSSGCSVSAKPVSASRVIATEQGISCFSGHESANARARAHVIADLFVLIRGLPKTSQVS